MILRCRSVSAGTLRTEGADDYSTGSTRTRTSVEKTHRANPAMLSPQNRGQWAKRIVDNILTEMAAVALCHDPGFSCYD